MRPPFTYDNLLPFEGKRVTLLATTGELADAIVCTVFKEERNLNYRILNTNRPERYANKRLGWVEGGRLVAIIGN